MSPPDRLSILIGNINPGSVSHGFTQSLLQTIPEGVFTSIHMEVAPPYLDVYRNKIVAHFLYQTDLRYLLFIDSDITFTAENISTLYSHADPDIILGGVYSSGFEECPPYDISPVIFEWQPAPVYSYVPDVEPVDKELLRPIGLPKYWEMVQKSGGGLIPVDAIGTGFMLIPRDLLLAMVDHFPPEYPWFAEEPHNNSPMGEDITFCHRLKEVMGVQTYADPQVRVTHKKQFDLIVPNQLSDISDPTPVERSTI